MIIKILNKFKTDYFYSKRRLSRLSREELLAILRHDCHRIEKSVYNHIFQSKRKYFEDKLGKVRLIFSILKQKNWYSDEHPIIQWAEQIEQNFYHLEKEFINVYKTEHGVNINYEKAEQLTADFKIRRSCRVWDDKQPSEDELKKFAHQMIDAARWAPNSGNRQAWKFSIITEPEKRILLKGLKEKHCYSAPL